MRKILSLLALVVALLGAAPAPASALLDPTNPIGILNPNSPLYPGGPVWQDDGDTNEEEQQQQQDTGGNQNNNGNSRDEEKDAQTETAIFYTLFFFALAGMGLAMGLEKRNRT